jgi:iron complex outermembrane recepter protein
MHQFRRVGRSVIYVAIGLTCCLAAHAMASGETFNIAAGAATTTLKEFASQAHVQLLFDYKAVQTLKTPAVKGQLEPMEALRQLLGGSGFTFREINDHTIAIVAPGASTSSLGTQEQSTSGTDPAAQGRVSSSGKVQLAQVGQVQAASNASTDDQEAPERKSRYLQEVVVTAQKREENLQSVPIPVSVITPQPLLDTDQVSLQEYYTQIPGLSMSPYSQGISTISLRGITTGQGGNPTVGIMVDDVPFGRFFGTTVAPDVDPNDLARIEVLRGPQGTLYGSSSLGGLIKYVTTDPSTQAVNGSIQVGTSSVYNGDALGYSVRGSVNIPLSNTLAIRASAFSREDPGYIDNPVSGVDGVNRTIGRGGMLAMLWQPSETVSLRVNALLQETKADGSNDVDLQSLGYVGPALGDLQQNYLPGIGGYDAVAQFYSAKLTVKLGEFDLTSLTGYNVTENTNSVDGTFSFGPTTQQYFGVPGTPLFTHDRDEDFTQELRLFGPLGTHVDWLLGLFYAHQYSPTYQTLAAENPSGAIVGWWETDDSYPSSYSEDAAFTDFTFHVTDRFDVQVGGRESHIAESLSQVIIGSNFTTVFLQLPSPVISPEVASRANAFTYLLTPRLTISPDMMLYARLASGYRAGGPNSGPGVPPEFGPDKTENYEVGMKADFIDHSVSVDTSVYYIDWHDIQLNLLNSSQENSYIANAGEAKSDGVELSIKWNPVAGLAISAWGTWDDAVLTKGFPASSTEYGEPGDRLPYSTRFSGNFSLDDQFPLPGGTTGFLGGTVSYVGDRVGEFQSDPQRQTYPSYTRTDLRAGIKYDSWTATLFVNNVADIRGQLAGGLGYVPPFGLQYIQPRTVGLTLRKSF